MLVRFCFGRGEDDFIRDVDLGFVPRVGEVVLLVFEDAPVRRRFRVFSVEHFIDSKRGVHSVGIVVDRLGI